MGSLIAIEQNASTGGFIDLPIDPSGYYGIPDTFNYAEGAPDYETQQRMITEGGDRIADSVSNFSAGFGDTISFGLTDLLRDSLGINDYVDKSSTAYSVGSWSGVAHSVGCGIGVGAVKAGTKGAGLEFSHWIPHRMGGPRNIFNGNFVTREFHALSDPFRHRFMKKAWKDVNRLPSMAIQQWHRIPYTIKGGATGLGYGLAGSSE